MCPLQEAPRTGDHVVCPINKVTHPQEAIGLSEFLSGEKKKRVSSNSLWPCLLTQRREEFSGSQTSWKEDQETQEGEKRPVAFSARDPGLFVVRNSLCACSVGKNGEELEASKQKWKLDSPTEHSVKIKTKHKIHEEGHILIGHTKLPRSMRAVPKKEVPKKLCQEDSDKDLEEVLGKKGNMEEALLGQVGRKGLQDELFGKSGKKMLLKSGSGPEPTLASRCHHNVMGRPNMVLNRRLTPAAEPAPGLDYIMSWNYTWDTSLDFFSPPNKIFYTHRNTSKFIKFEKIH
ncbi:LOW QUALITY PROTEIN: Lysine-rich nucleolar protein 1, partial [Galemys pyrenaicus]